MPTETSKSTVSLPEPTTSLNRFLIEVESSDAENPYLLEVDDQGYLLGADKWAEGMFGVVVQVFSQNKKNQKNSMSLRALKMPRMLYDTSFENRAVLSAMEDEIKTIRSLDENKKTSFLFGPKSPGTNFSIFRSIGDNLFVFIACSFCKGKPPRFVQVKVKKISDGVYQKYELYPPITGSDILTRQANFQINLNQNRINEPYVLQTPLGVEQSQIVSLKSADRFNGGNWYIGLPTILYEWASTSLQQQILKGFQVENVSGSDSLDFFMGVCKLTEGLTYGLENLHQSDMVHGDLRPANIMSVSPSPKPFEYAMIDFGNFAQSQVNNSDIGRYELPGRYSPFYAPEKNDVYEREDCNYAVFYRRSSDKKIMLILGWSSDIASIDHKKELKGFSSVEANLEKNEQSSLKKGDCLRIRDFIFYVDTDYVAKSISDKAYTKCRFILCDCNFFSIQGEKIIQKEDDLLNDDDLDIGISIPKVIQINKNSFATDIYSLGVLFLYIFYCHAQIKSQRDYSLIDGDFKILVENLKGSYFLSLSREIFMISNGNWNNELDIVKIDKIAKEICYSSRGASEILKIMDGNSFLLVLIFDFALRCIHRKDMVNAAIKDKNEKFVNYFFCSSREECDKDTIKNVRYCISQIASLSPKKNVTTIQITPDLTFRPITAGELRDEIVRLEMLNLHLKKYKFKYFFIFMLLIIFVLLLLMGMAFHFVKFDLMVFNL